MERGTVRSYRLYSASNFRLAVSDAARRAHEQGTSAADAAAAFTLPDSLGEWTLFNKQFFERAFEAWYRDLDR